MSTGGWTEADVLRINALRSVRRPLGAKVDLTPEPETPKPSKYRNVKTLADGFVFDSQKEAECWLVLKLREKAGDITELRRQIDLPLYAPVLTYIDGLPHVAGLSVQIATYRADAIYRDAADGRKHILDAKGVRTRQYLLKRKWLELQENAIIEEV